MATFNLHATKFHSILLSEPSKVVAIFCCSIFSRVIRVRLWEGLLKQSAVVFTTTSPQLAKVARPKEAGRGARVLFEPSEGKGYQRLYR